MEREWTKDTSIPEYIRININKRKKRGRETKREKALKQNKTQRKRNK
jgi:hypothetical protein